MSWFTKLTAVVCLVLGIASIYFVGIVAHQPPIGILLLPLAWYWWREE